MDYTGNMHINNGLGVNGFLSLGRFVNELKRPDPDYRKAAEALTHSAWYKQVGNRSKNHINEMRNIDS